MTSTVYFDPAIGGSGTTYNDGTTPPYNLANGGHRTNLLPLFTDVINVTSFSATQSAAALVSATTATTQAGLASASAAAAANSASSVAITSTSTTSLLIAVASKSFTTQANKQYVTGQFVVAASAANPANYMFGQVTSYSTTTLIVSVISVGGSGTYADWNISLAGERGATGAAGANAPLLYSARTSNTILTEAENGYFIDITSGTFTQTFDTVTSGWYVYIRNAGTGDITLDPSGGELIDGVTSYVMPPQECRLIQRDGSAFHSIIIQPFKRTILSTMTSSIGPGYSSTDGFLWGGGGAGGYGSGVYGGSGGGGGACVPFSIPMSAYGTSQLITIAAGGTAVTSVGSGGIGGTSSIGSLVYSYGGGGGGGSAADTHAGGGGGGALGAGNSGAAANYSDGGQPRTATVTGTSYGNCGFGGAPGLGTTFTTVSVHSAWGGAGGGSGTKIAGNSLYGGAGGGSASGGANYAPGTSTFGGNGGDANHNGAATAGAVPGGGGGGTQTGSTSGAGAAGKCIQWGVI